MRDAVIVEAVRTPVGERNGALAAASGAPVGTRAGRPRATCRARPGRGQGRLLGCGNQVGDQASHATRSAVLAASWPESIPGTTVDRQYGSSQQMVHFATAGVYPGQYDMVVAGGVECMTRVPLGWARASGGQPYADAVFERYGVTGFNQGTGAEMIARKWGFSRPQLDEFSLSSHQKAADAIDASALDGQLAPLPGVLSADEGARRNGSLDKLASLPTPFDEDGVISAGNSSQIPDGASALLVMTGEKAVPWGLRRSPGCRARRWR